MNDAALAAHLHQLEAELLRPETRRDSERVAQLLADDFREFGASGRTYDKPAILAQLTAETPAQIYLTDFACEQLTPEIALVTYRSHQTDANGTRGALRSSVWIRRDGRWQILFHQGTRLEPA